MGGFGLFEYDEPISIVWNDSAKSRHDFRIGCHRWGARRYCDGASSIEPFPTNSQLADAKKATGEALFDIIVGIINGKEDHPNVHLELTQGNLRK
jgi:hypothetical protein